MRTGLLVALLGLPSISVAAQDAPGSGGEPGTLWNTLLFDAPQWTPGGVVGFGSVALWMFVLGALAVIQFSTPPRRLAQLTALAAGATLLWSLLPHPGPMTQIGLPLALGFAAGWHAVKGTATFGDAARFGFVATLIGATAGGIVFYALHRMWADAGILVFGAERFRDVLFTLPMGALLGAVAFRLVPDIVHAFEEANQEEAVPAGPATGQAEGFLVTCLRCRTEIKVDRSMKRFRVATDRFEFACPNCQYWMEWADPGQPQGAAAA